MASSRFPGVEWGIFLASPQTGGNTGPREEVRFDSDLRRRFRSSGRRWSSPALECALPQACSHGLAYPCPFWSCKPDGLRDLSRPCTSLHLPPLKLHLPCLPFLTCWCPFRLPYSHPPPALSRTQMPRELSSPFPHGLSSLPGPLPGGLSAPSISESGSKHVFLVHTPKGGLERGCVISTCPSLVPSGRRGAPHSAVPWPFCRLCCERDRWPRD